MSIMNLGAGFKPTCTSRGYVAVDVYESDPTDLPRKRSGEVRDPWRVPTGEFKEFTVQDLFTSPSVSDEASIVGLELRAQGAGPLERVGVFSVDGITDVLHRNIIYRVRYRKIYIKPFKRTIDDE